MSLSRLSRNLSQMLGLRARPQAAPAATPIVDAWSVLGNAPATDMIAPTQAAFVAFAEPATLPLRAAAPSRPAPAALPPLRVAIPGDDAIAIFGPEDLPQLENFAGLAERIVAGTQEDCSLRNAGGVPVDFVPGGVEFGRNLFGTGEIPPVFRGSAGLMRGVTTSLLHDVVISGQSTSIQSIARGFFGPSVRLIERDGKLAALPRLEPFYEADEDGAVRVRRAAAPIERHDVVAVPLCGSGFHNYGHFLYDGLPAALMYRAALPGTPIRLVGGRLAEWQRQLLAGLGMLELHVEVIQPTCFSRVLTSDLLSLHVSYPTRFVRPVFDMLRFILGGAGPRQRIVFFSRGSDTQRRVVSNRAEVEAALAAEGVEIVQPERLSVPQQVALAAASRFVIGEAGAGMANVGFCEPGTAVLEIQHEKGPDGWTRAACRMMGLHWHFFAAADDAAGMAAHAAPKPHAVMRIDAAALVAAVRTIKATL